MKMKNHLNLRRLHVPYFLLYRKYIIMKYINSWFQKFFKLPEKSNKHNTCFQILQDIPILFSVHQFWKRNKRIVVEFRGLIRIWPNNETNSFQGFQRKGKIVSLRFRISFARKKCENFREIENSKISRKQ